MTPADTNALTDALRLALPAWPWEARPDGWLVAWRTDVGLMAVVGTKRAPVVGAAGMLPMFAAEMARGPRGRGTPPA